MQSRRGPEVATVLLLVLLSLGCSSTSPTPMSPAQVSGWEAADLEALGATDVERLGAEGGSAFDSTDSGFGERMMVRSAQITVTLDDLDRAAAEVEGLVASFGGYVEQSQSEKDSNVSISCRVPSARLEEIIDAVAKLGDERDRYIWARDVTDDYADLETRLKNNRALRDRLQTLLDRATKVEDVLAIEKELNRVQSEVESMQGRLDRLASQVELSPLRVILERKRILGPLGYLGYGLWWAVTKLFVIQ